MNALADALKPLVASGPKLLAGLSRIQDVSDREALAEAVGAALAEQASRVAAANAAASGKENAAAAAAAPAPAAPAPATRQLTPLDDAAAIMRGVSFTQPWGSFDVAFFPGDKLVLRSAQKAGAGPVPASSAAANVKELVVPISSVRAVAVLDAVPEEQAAFVLLGLKPAVALPWASAAMIASGSGASLDCLALRIPNSAPEDSLSFGSGNDAVPIRGNRAIVLCAALGKAGVPPAAFLAPDPAVFSSAAAAAASASGGNGGGCSVRAAVKASQGHLFPLGDRAIAFVKKPALLVSLRALRAAELARVGSGSASFDLLLHLRGSTSPGGKEEEEGGRVLEFGQIPRQELAQLRRWLEERGVPLGASAEEGAGGAKKRKGAAAAAAAAAEEEDEESDDDSDDDDDEASSSDDEDDEDFDPKAAAAELKAQEEAEKEEDEEEEAGVSSGDDDGDRPAKKNKI